VRIDIALSVHAWPLQSVILTDTDPRMPLLSSSTSHQGLHIFTKARDQSLLWESLTNTVGLLLSYTRYT
jgi:hypothetical protein